MCSVAHRGALPSWAWLGAIILVCTNLACGFRSLDYLQAGHHDAAVAGDAMTSEPDTGDGPVVNPGDLDAFLGVGGAGGQVGPDARAGGTDAVAAGLDLSASGAGGNTAPGADGPLATGGASGTGGVVQDAPFGDGGGGGRDAAADAAGGAVGTGGGSGGGVGFGGTVGSGGIGTGGIVGSGGQGTGGRGSGGAATGGSAGTPKSVMMVVGSLTLNSGDSALQSHLVGAGFTVNPVLDKNLGSSPSVADDAVLVSRTVSSSEVGSKFRNTSKPVMVLEPLLYPDMDMVDGSSASGTTSSTSNSVVVNASAGALAAGLSGTVTIFSSGQQLGYGAPSGQAIKVATVPSNSAEWAIFAFDAGAQMSGLNAPARRMGFLFTQTSAASMTSNGWALFDAAMAWLTQ